MAHHSSGEKRVRILHHSKQEQASCKYHAADKRCKCLCLTDTEAGEDEEDDQGKGLTEWHLGRGNPFEP